MKTFDAGVYRNQGRYKSFLPCKINRNWKIEDMALLQLLGEADRQIGRLDMYSEYIPNMNLFISMHVVKEASQSSKIEGTKTNIEEALLDREDVHTEKRADWEEVQNYIKALDTAIYKLKKLPLSSRLLRETHKILLQGVRGTHKLPGCFRKSQNWIGGNNINTATFVPPHHSEIDACMADLENFAHNTNSYFPDLLKIALLHYQFETIHPFLDGNGRVGRLLITLYLVERKILKNPVLYLSDFFEKNRDSYYEKLTKVRENNEIVEWFSFFLKGVIATAKSSIQTFDKVLKLQKEVETQIQSLGRRTHNAQLLLNHLFQKPVVNAKKTQKVTQLSAPSAYKLLKDMEALKILHEITGSKRGKTYVFKTYIELFH